MRSKQRRGSVACLFSLVCLLSLSAVPGVLHAAGKAKPDLPLGEESYEPAASAKKASSQTSEQRAESPHTNAPQKKQDPLAAPPEEHGEVSKPSEHGSGGSTGHSATPAGQQKETGEESATSQKGGSGSSDHTAASPAAGEESHAATDTPEQGEEGKLLEGKVPPATPEKGSGFIWFGVVFVVLAIAIFVFT